MTLLPVEGIRALVKFDSEISMYEFSSEDRKELDSLMAEALKLVKDSKEVYIYLYLDSDQGRKEIIKAIAKEVTNKELSLSFADSSLLADLSLK